MSQHPTFAHPPLDPRRWIVLVVILVAAFMVLLDISIVNVAIPSIQRGLDASYSQVQFVIAGYALAYAVVLITGGRLGDIYGRKRLFLLGMAGFVLASALCGFAANPLMLVGSRVLQGLMAALMFPQVLSIIQVSFPVHERSSAFAIFGATIGLATITGPTLGGLLIQGDLLGLSWRPIFLVNLPVGIFALVMAMVLLRESKAERALHLDIPGVVIVTVGLMLLTYPLIEGRDAGWPLWTYISMVASVPVLVLFVGYERFKKRRDNSPLVELGLFRDRAFVVGILISLVFFSALGSFFLVISIFLQVGLGFTALGSGMTTIPFAAGSFTTSVASARLIGRLGKSILQSGAVLMFAGMGGMVATIHFAPTPLQGWYLAPALLVTGLGIGLIIAPLANIILAGIHTGDAGSASGVVTTGQQVGSAIGIAVIGLVFFGLLGANADASARQQFPAFELSISDLHLPPAAVTTIESNFVRCFGDRARESDPTVVPASCVPPRAFAGTPAGRRVAAAVTDAATRARVRDFTDSEQGTLGYQLGVYLLTFILVFFLPQPDFRRRPGPPAAE